MSALKESILETEATKEKPSQEVVSVVEARLHLPEESPLAREIGRALGLLHSLVGHTTTQLQRLIEQALEVEYENAEGSTIRRASLVFPPKDEDDRIEARKLLDPRRTKPKPRQRRKSTGQSTKKKGPSAAFLALPSHLKLNSYGLCEERPNGKLVFRLVERYEGLADTAKPEKGVKIFTWELPSNYLQMVIKRWLAPTALLAELPTPTRQGTTQENAQQTLSYLGLKECDEQPYNSFPASSDRRLSVHLRLWQQSMRKLARRTKPFTYRHKQGRRQVIDEDWQIFRRGPRPERMPGRFIESKSIRVFRRRWQDGSRQQERLYALIPLYKGLGEEAKLRHGRSGRDSWWHQCLSEFSVLPAWADKRLKPDDEHIMVPLGYGHSRGFTEALTDPRNRVCWALLAERRERQGSHRLIHWYLQLTLERGIEPPARPNLLVAMPTLEQARVVTRERDYTGPCSCIRWALVQNGAIMESGREVVDAIPTRPAQRGRSWQRTRRLKAVEAARRIARWAAESAANLAIGEVAAPDKRHGSGEANILQSRWNYLDVATALEHKALGHEPPIAVIGVSDYEGQFTCPTCGACRKAKAPRETAETYQAQGQLHCHSCGATTLLTVENRLLAVAQAAWRRYHS